ncbi:MAG: toxin TcdB middle/N-terminal domain-containing protein, partial [Candidatus Omnitrophota bacterium]
MRLNRPTKIIACLVSFIYLFVFLSQDIALARDNSGVSSKIQRQSSNTKTSTKTSADKQSQSKSQVSSTIKTSAPITSKLRTSTITNTIEGGTVDIPDIPDIPDQPKPKDTRGGSSALSGSSKDFSSFGLIPPVEADLFSGRANIAIPLEVTPGRRNIQPNLALVNIGAQNTWCGATWNLELGSIERSTKRGFPKYDNTDTFVYNTGSSQIELVPIAVNLYQAKIEEAFLKIYFNGTSWEITDKSGTKYYFGTTLNSRQINPNNNQVFKWSLEKVSDLYTNYMNVTYTQDQNELYPQRIEYTGNETTSLSPTYSIDFILENRPDTISSSRQGFTVTTAKRLKQIDLKYNNSLVKRYELNYTISSNSQRSLIQSITLFGSDGVTTLPAINFAYQNANIALGNLTLGLSGLGDSSYTPFTGDFNADGFTDVGAYSSTLGWVQCAINDKNNNFITQPGFYGPAGCSLFSGDFNGDTLTDLAFHNGYGTIKVCFNNGFGFDPAINYGTIPTASYHQATTGDFNGDGFTDFCLAQNYAGWAGLSWTICLNNTVDGFLPGQVWLTGFGAAEAAMFEGDFNADGLTDIGVYQYGTMDHFIGDWYIALNSGNNTFTNAGRWKSNYGSPYHIPLIGDFNGDGLTDIGICNYLNGSFIFAISDGTKFVDQGSYWGFTGTEIIGGDFNADGKTDLIQRTLPQGSSNWNVTNSQGPVVDLLSEVNNGLGARTTITYQASTLYDNTGEDELCDLPFSVQTVKTITSQDGLGNSYVTTYEFKGGSYNPQEREFRGFGEAKAIDVQGNYTKSYFHQDNIFKGRPWKQETYDHQNQLLSRTESTWSNQELNSGVKYVYLAQKDDFIFDGQEIPKHTRATYTYDNFGNPTQVTSLGDIGVTNDEKSVVSEYLHNQNLHILGVPKRVLTKDASQNTLSEKLLFYDNSNNINTIPIRAELSKEQLIIVNNLASTTITPQNNYLYDNLGNLIQAQDSLGRVTTTSYDTVLKMYPTIITNSLGQITQSTYDASIAKVLTSTDPNNQTTTNVYDTFGRLIKVIGPNDTLDSPAIIYEYDLTSCPIKVTKRVKTAYNQSPNTYLTTYQFYDGLGRLIETKSPAEDESILHTPRQIISDIVKFDQRGQVSEKYLPYFVPASSNYVAPTFQTPHITFEYDALGRNTRVINADGSFSQTIYNQWTITNIDENNHQITKHLDAYGKIIQVQEFNQGQTYTTNYAYDPQGNLIQITDNQNNITRIWYDSAGRKIKMDDPDMGIWLYEYDLLGNLTKQTDNKGQVIEFTYDNLNRLVQKSAILPGQNGA